MRKYALLLLGSFYFLACGNSQSAPAPAPVPAVAPAPTPAPRTTPTTSNYAVNTSRAKADVQQTYPYDIQLKNKAGELVSSSEVLIDGDKPTVILYWLSTCMPCMVEMKAIKAKYAQWKEEADFNLVAISTDFPKRGEQVFPVAEKQGWPWPVYHDVNREFRLVMPGELNGLPQSFIILPDGEIVYHKRKYRPGDEDALFAKIRSL